MERLTTRVHEKSSLVKGMSIFDIEEAIDLLAAIEDILGDEYDLDRLREMVEADREGRCIIAPVRPGEIAWCGFKQQDPIKGTEKHVVYPVVLRGWWTGIVGAEYDPRHFEFDQLYDSEESAEAALRREQDGNRI